MTVRQHTKEAAAGVRSGCREIGEDRSIGGGGGRVLGVMHHQAATPAIVADNAGCHGLCTITVAGGGLASCGKADPSLGLGFRV